MARLKAHRRVMKFLKNVLKKMFALAENMEIPEQQNMFSPMEAPSPFFSKSLDSGYNSINTNKVTKPKEQNNNMVWIKSKCQNYLPRHDGEDYDLGPFWLSAESEYWPCKKKTLEKVDINCRINTNEDFLKHVIKLVYNSFQESSHRVDGTTDHLVGNIKSILSVYTNEALVSNENQISLCDMTPEWEVFIIDVGNAQKYTKYTDLMHKIHQGILDLGDESSRLKFTAKQNSHIMHFDSKERRRDMILQKLNLKRRTKKMETCITTRNQDISITFHFIE